MSSIASDEPSSINSEVLRPHGQEYEVIDDLNVDPQANRRYNRAARFNFPNGEGFEQHTDIGRPIAEYFYLLFPMGFLPELLTQTNLIIQDSAYPNYLKYNLTRGELFKWLGIKLAMILSPLRGGIDAYFASENEIGTVYEAGNFGKRFKMSKGRFKIIQESLRFAPENRQSTDPWNPIRPFIDAFNTRNASVVIPGIFLCIDECMSMWKGLDGKIAGIFGLPHKTKIARKPEGVGAEMKTLACVETGLIIKADLMEGVERNAQKNYADQGAGTGTSLRLTEAYHRSGRVLIGDSWFASVQTCVALFQVYFLSELLKPRIDFSPKNFCPTG
jgi:hypothetical protein